MIEDTKDLRSFIDFTMYSDITALSELDCKVVAHEDEHVLHLKSPHGTFEYTSYRDMADVDDDDVVENIMKEITQRRDFGLLSLREWKYDSLDVFMNIYYLLYFFRRELHRNCTDRFANLSLTKDNVSLTYSQSTSSQKFTCIYTYDVLRDVATLNVFYRTPGNQDVMVSFTHSELSIFDSHDMIKSLNTCLKKYYRVNYVYDGHVEGVAFA